MSELRRRLAGVTLDDRSTAGRPRLWAYGMRWIARVGDVQVATVRRAVAAVGGEAPRLDPGDPIEVVAWALERRGAPSLAAAVRHTLGAQDGK